MNPISFPVPLDPGHMWRLTLRLRGAQGSLAFLPLGSLLAVLEQNPWDQDLLVARHLLPCSHSRAGSCPPAWQTELLPPLGQAFLERPQARGAPRAGPHPLHPQPHPAAQPPGAGSCFPGQEQPLSPPVHRPPWFQLHQECQQLPQPCRPVPQVRDARTAALVGLKHLVS